MTDEKPIRGAREAAEVLGMTRRALRSLNNRCGAELGMPRSGPGKSPIYTPELIERLRAYRAIPSTVKVAATKARRKGVPGEAPQPDMQADQASVNREVSE